MNAPAHAAAFTAAARLPGGTGCQQADRAGPRAPGAPASAGPQGRSAPVLVRTARPADLPAIQAFVAALSPLSRSRRFFTPRRDLPAFLGRAIAQGDPRHHFTVAEAAGPSPAGLIGLGQSARLPGRDACELALVVADAWQGRGVGSRLLQGLLDDAAEAGLRALEAEVLPENRPMLALARRFGFAVVRHPDDPRLLRLLLETQPAVRARPLAPGRPAAPLASGSASPLCTSVLCPA